MAMLNNQRVSFLDTFGKAIHWSNHTWKIFMVRKSPFMGFSWVAFSQVQNDPLPNHFLIPVFCFKSSFFRFTILNNIFFLDGATPMTALRPFIAGGGESVAELLEVKGIMSHHIFWDSYQPSSIFHAMGSVFFFLWRCWAISTTTRDDMLWISKKTSLIIFLETSTGWLL